MAFIGRPKSELILTDEEREELGRLARRARSAPHVSFRAKIVLRCAALETNGEVARVLHTSNATVGKWRERFVEHRMDGLHDEPRPGAPRLIGDDKIEEVVTKTLETTPRGRRHWSTRSMAKHLGLSPSRSDAFGERSVYSRIGRSRFECRKTHSSLKKYATSLGCT